MHRFLRNNQNIPDKENQRWQPSWRWKLWSVKTWRHFSDEQKVTRQTAALHHGEPLPPPSRLITETSKAHKKDMIAHFYHLTSVWMNVRLQCTSEYCFYNRYRCYEAIMTWCAMMFLPSKPWMTHTWFNILMNYWATCTVPSLDDNYLFIYVTFI